LPGERLVASLCSLAVSLLLVKSAAGPKSLFAWVEKSIVSFVAIASFCERIFFEVWCMENNFLLV